jgi:hypothetical protein
LKRLRFGGEHLRTCETTTIDSGCFLAHCAACLPSGTTCQLLPRPRPLTRLRSTEEKIIFPSLSSKITMPERLSKDHITLVRMQPARAPAMPMNDLQPVPSTAQPPLAALAAGQQLAGLLPVAAAPAAASLSPAPPAPPCPE